MGRWDELNSKYKYSSKPTQLKLPVPFEQNENPFDWQKFIDSQNLFWQYPVWTERQFYQQVKNSSNYAGFPWATILDKRVPGWNAESLIPRLKSNFDPGISYITSCQHIRFRELKNACKQFNIKVLYTSHKRIGEDWLGDYGDTELRACPLFAVNIEDERRNQIFQSIDLLSRHRKYLYSFVGSYKPDCYISPIRKNIFDMKHPKDAYISRTEHWHFKDIVYHPKQNVDMQLNETGEYKHQCKHYNEILLNSRFSLCPSGTGPNSIRFWESLGAGSIPVLLSDTLELPDYVDLDWSQGIIRVKESKFQEIPDILREITPEEERARREMCLKLYDHYRQYYY